MSVLVFALLFNYLETYLKKHKKSKANVKKYILAAMHIWYNMYWCVLKF